MSIPPLKLQLAHAYQYLSKAIHDFSDIEHFGNQQSRIAYAIVNMLSSFPGILLLSRNMISKYEYITISNAISHLINIYYSFKSIQTEFTKTPPPPAPIPILVFQKMLYTIYEAIPLELQNEKNQFKWLCLTLVPHQKELISRQGVGLGIPSHL